MSAPEEKIIIAYETLLFSIRRSVRYHNRRRSFFDRFSKLTTIMSVLGGSAIIVSILSKVNNLWALCFSVIVAIAATFDLVINSSQMARFHHDMSRKYIEIEKNMVLKNPDNLLISQWTAARLDIEAEEPPVLHILNTICHNELCRALGFPQKEIHKISPLQRLFCQIIDIGEHKIQNSYACETEMTPEK